MRKLTVLVALVMIVGLAACGGNGEATETGGGDAVAGEQVYNSVATPACNTCHSLEAGQALVGPSLNGIGALAATRVGGMSAEEYLHESIIDPNTYVVEGFGSGIMPDTYETQLSEEQLNDLVAFLLTQ